jgi:hypothetical protein
MQITGTSTAAPSRTTRSAARGRNRNAAVARPAASASPTGIAARQPRPTTAPRVEPAASSPATMMVSALRSSSAFPREGTVPMPPDSSAVSGSVVAVAYAARVKVAAKRTRFAAGLPATVVMTPTPASRTAGLVPASVSRAKPAINKPASACPPAAARPTAIAGMAWSIQRRMGSPATAAWPPAAGSAPAAGASCQSMVVPAAAPATLNVSSVTAMAAACPSTRMAPATAALASVTMSGAWTHRSPASPWAANVRWTPTAAAASVTRAAWTASNLAPAAPMTATVVSVLATRVPVPRSRS